MNITEKGKKNTNSKGFTLVELMVVVAIIAILAVIGLTVFTGAQKSSRDAKRKGDVTAISDALEVHVNTTLNQYCTAAAGLYCAPLPAWFAGNVIPTDPSTAVAYPTNPVNGAATYTITATLEGGGTFALSNRQ